MRYYKKYFIPSLGSLLPRLTKNLKYSKVFARTDHSYLYTITRKENNKKYLLQVLYDNANGHKALKSIYKLPEGIYPKIHSLNKEKNHYYLIMDYLHDQTLDQLVRNNIEHREKIRIMRDVALQLSILKQHNMSHDNFSLKSIYVDRNFMTYLPLCNFGVPAKKVYDYEEALGISTVKSHIYQDEYAYGKSMFELLTNKKLFLSSIAKWLTLATPFVISTLVTHCSTNKCLRFNEWLYTETEEACDEIITEGSKYRSELVESSKKYYFKGLGEKVKYHDIAYLYYVLDTLYKDEFLVKDSSVKDIMEYKNGYRNSHKELLKKRAVKSKHIQIEKDDPMYKQYVKEQGKVTESTIIPKKHRGKKSFGLEAIVLSFLSIVVLYYVRGCTQVAGVPLANEARESITYLYTPTIPKSTDKEKSAFLAKSYTDIMMLSKTIYEVNSSSRKEEKLIAVQKKYNECVEKIQEYIHSGYFETSLEPLTSRESQYLYFQLLLHQKQYQKLKEKYEIFLPAVEEAVDLKDIKKVYDIHGPYNSEEKMWPMLVTMGVTYVLGGHPSEVQERKKKLYTKGKELGKNIIIDSIYTDVDVPNIEYIEKYHRLPIKYTNTYEIMRLKSKESSLYGESIVDEVDQFYNKIKPENNNKVR